MFSLLLSLSPYPPIVVSKDDEHARALEEQWIDSLDSGSGGSEVLHTSAVTILQGLIIGFFFPLLPFFFLNESRPAVFWEDGRLSETVSSVLFS